MKKILVVLLTTLLCLSTAGCTSKARDSASPAATPEPELTEEEKWAQEVKKYAGEFVAVDMKNESDEGDPDYKTFLEESFADKSYYVYCTVSEDGHFDMIIVDEGEVNDVYAGQQIIFDPLKGSIYLRENPNDSMTLEVVDYDSFSVSFEGQMVAFKRSTDIPHNNQKSE
ncbi:MAG: hypothetical protein Q4F09_06525 [Erysipelotrichaceae bacterium]|nr:hypothetical protein [Erysipelotrichaceae bacterium]